MAPSTMAIPDDVAFTILSKLPLKSLKRFTLLHKSCADLLEIPHFMTMFCSNFLSQHQSHYDDASLLLLQQQSDIYCDGSLYLLSGDKLEKTVISRWLPYQDRDRFLRVSGSGIHGILCLQEAPDRKFVLWNPATGEFRTTSRSPRESHPNLEAEITPHGFGYDSVTDDFKVLRHISYYSHYDYMQDEYHFEVDNDNDNDNDGDGDGDGDGGLQDEDEDDQKDWPMSPDYLPSRIPQPFWEIYSLRSNSWRKLDADMPSIGNGPGMGGDIYMNGVCHWLGYTRSDDYGIDTHLVSFNFSNEIFYTTPLPLNLADTRVRKYLAVLNESIALISMHEETKTFHISILGEQGVKESWTKLFIVGLGPLQGVELPIAVGKMGEMIFSITGKGELALFDLRTQMLKEIAATGLVDYDQMIIYKGSILPIGRTGY